MLPCTYSPGKKYRKTFDELPDPGDSGEMQKTIEERAKYDLPLQRRAPGGGEGICGDLLRCAHASARDWRYEIVLSDHAGGELRKT